MSRDQYDVEVEKQRTKRDLIEKIFWILAMLIVIGGCVAEEIVTK